jgi:hypothetical protein
MSRLTAIVLVLALGSGNAFSSATHTRSLVLGLVQQIQKADYAGDRDALHRLCQQLQPFDKNKQLASRVRYWQGFALWRRALNGANESVSAADLDADLAQAADEFREATKDPAFVNAKIALASCLLFRVFLHAADPGQVRLFLPDALQNLREAQAVAPDNPRLLWVEGANDWYLPAERGGGQAKAIATYLRGLEAARQQPTPADPLDPSWGEPELLMNLAWSNLHKTTPDLDEAEKDALAALALVPRWHYVRDRLLPQIQAARTAP